MTKELQTNTEVVYRALVHVAPDGIVIVNQEGRIVLVNSQTEKLIDVILPGTSGVQLAQRLTAKCPRMCVLYVSGYIADAISHHGGHDPDFAFLSKPFSLPALGRKIRSILDADPSRPSQGARVSQTARV
jgi:FixJ family two-component response regulator